MTTIEILEKSGLQQELTHELYAFVKPISDFGY
jgi:hypothetical protein